MNTSFIEIKLYSDLCYFLNLERCTFERIMGKVHFKYIFYKNMTKIIIAHNICNAMTFYTHAVNIKTPTTLTIILKNHACCRV